MRIRKFMSKTKDINSKSYITFALAIFLLELLWFMFTLFCANTREDGTLNSRDFSNISYADFPFVVRDGFWGGWHTPDFYSLPLPSPPNLLLLLQQFKTFWWYVILHYHFLALLYIDTEERILRRPFLSLSYCLFLVRITTRRRKKCKYR